MARDWRHADLGAADRALCAFADKLTREVTTMTAADLDELRGHGLDDAAIHDAAQVISYFNYINRVAESLGVDLEAGIRAWEGEGEDQDGRG